MPYEDTYVPPKKNVDVKPLFDNVVKQDQMKVKPYPVSDIIPKSLFWDEATKHMMNGGRLRFAGMPARDFKTSSAYVPQVLEKYLPKDGAWLRGMKGALNPETITEEHPRGQTYAELEYEARLSRYPGAEGVGETGTPWYVEGSLGEQTKARAENWWKYGVEEMPETEMMEGESVASYLQRQIKTNTDKADALAKERAEQGWWETWRKEGTLDKARYFTQVAFFNDTPVETITGGFLRPTNRQGRPATMSDIWGEGLTLVGGIIGRLSTGQMRPDDRKYLQEVAERTKAQARKEDDWVGAIFPLLAEGNEEYRNIITSSGSYKFQYGFKRGWANVKNVFDVFAGGTPETIIRPESMIHRGIAYAKSHPNATEAEMWYVARDPIYGDISDPLMNPVNWGIEIASDAVGNVAFSVLGDSIKFVSQSGIGGKMMLKWSDEVLPEIASVLGKTENAKIFGMGGASGDVVDQVVTNELGEAVMAGAKGVAQRIEETARSKSLIGWTNSSKVSVYTENLQVVNSWVAQVLAKNPDPEQYAYLMRHIANLSSDNVSEVNEALRVLSRYPNMQFLLTDRGMTASHAIKMLVDQDPKWIAKVYKQLDEAVTPMERLLVALSAQEDLIEKIAGKNVFPDIIKQADAPAFYKATAKVHNQLQKFYNKANKIVTTMYLKWSPGYATRNLTNNTAQIAWDLGSVPYSMSTDVLYKYMGVADDVELATVYGEDVFRRMFVGMDRGIAGGTEGVVTGVAKKGEKGLVRNVKDIRNATDASEFYELKGSEAIFKKVFPQEMDKLVRGNISNAFVEHFDIPIDDARALEDLILHYHTDVDMAFEKAVEQALKGHYDAIAIQKMPDDLRFFLKEYNLDDELADIIATSADADEVTRRYSEVVAKKVDEAKKALQKEPHGPVVGMDDTIDYLNTAVTDGTLDPVVRDAWITYEGQNQRANEEVKETFVSWYRNLRLEVDRLTGNTEATDRVLKQVMKNIKLETDGTFAVLGDLDGVTYLQRQFSGRHNQIVQNIFEKPAKLMDKRNAELAKIGTDVKKLEEWLRENMPKALDDLGDAKLTRKYVDHKVWEEFTDARRKIHQSWRDNNYRFAKRLMGETNEALRAGGMTTLPVLDDRYFHLMDEAVQTARKFDNHLPKNFVEFDLRTARKIPERVEQNGQFVQLYAKFYGIDKLYTADGRINQKYLLNILNKQMNSDYKSIFQINNLSEDQIKQAFRAHSIGELRNTYQTADDVLRSVQRVLADPSGVLRADDRRLQDFVRTLDTLDTDLAQRWSSAVDARKALQGGDATAIKEADKALMDLSVEVSNLFKRNIDDADEIAERVMRETLEADPDFVPEWNGIDPPSPARAVWDSRDQLIKNIDDVDTYVQLHFNDTVRANIQKSADWMNKVDSMKKFAHGYMNDARMTALASAKEARDFILHNYADRINLDTMISYVAPYHFWHTRNAANWGKRLVKDPWLAKPYIEYKRNQQKLNKDAPEWFKSRVNLQEMPLLGALLDHPFYVDLEGMLFPLGKMVDGVDFGNPEGKHETLVGKAIEGVSKTGINPHSFMSLFLAIHHLTRGNNEVADRLLGRMSPQSKFFRAVSSQWLGMNNGVGVELDPYRILMHIVNNKTIKGATTAMDTYEAGAVSIILDEGIKEGKYTLEQVQELLVDNKMDDPIMVEARAKAQGTKNWSSILSFIGSPALRPFSDIEIQDAKMKREFSTLWDNKDILAPDDYAEEMARLRAKYPSYYGVASLIKDPPDQRDVGYTYSVLARIAPSQSKTILGMAGVDDKTLREFYDTKGKSILSLPDEKRWEFMAGIRKIGAVLALPDTATQNEWITVKKMNAQLEQEIKEYYGEDIWMAKDVYWTLEADERRGFLALNPTLKEMMNDMTMAKLQNPLLAKYYSSFDSARAMANAEMYERLDAEFPQGAEMQAQYFIEKDRGMKPKASDYLKNYWDRKSQLEELYAFGLVDLAKYMVKGDEVILPKRIIPDPEKLGEEERNIYDFRGESTVPEYYDFTWDDWEAVIDDPVLSRLSQDWAFRGASLSRDMEKALNERIKAKLGERVDLAEVLPLMQGSARQSGAQYYSPENLPWWMPQAQQQQQALEQKPQKIKLEDGTEVWAIVDANGQWIQVPPP